MQFDSLFEAGDGFGTTLWLITPNRGVGLFLYGSNECPDNIRKYLGKSGKAFLSHVGAKEAHLSLFGTLLSVMMQSSAAVSSLP